MSHPAQGQPRALGSRRLSRHERKPSGESGHAAPSREKGVDGSVSGAGAKGVAGDTTFRVLGPGGRLSSQVERHPRVLAGGSGLRCLQPAGGASTGRGRVGFPFCRHLHGEDSHPGGGGAGESISETPRKCEPRSCSPYVTGLESFSAARRATRKPRYADPAPPHEVREGAHRWPDTQVGRKEAHVGESVTGRRRPAEPGDRCRPRRVSGAGLGLPSPAPAVCAPAPRCPRTAWVFCPCLLTPQL